MLSRQISGVPKLVLLWSRIVAGLVIVAVIMGVSAGCGLNEPVLASGNGLKKKLKNREQTEIKSRHSVAKPQKGQR
jgi:hypothetical protein